MNEREENKEFSRSGDRRRSRRTRHGSAPTPRRRILKGSVLAHENAEKFPTGPSADHDYLKVKSREGT
ncbi:hypothetical protein EVAR_91378_1 [Eumeta japonica]|uniref:Uncharacterized protein n=1 Tax=Eumeta variegata TaxID=151549 RepID=A0A4C1XAX4_EUMVA|nr:hypothetical protein EVAR_91378_1 [Eumeta japonica]